MQTSVDIAPMQNLFFKRGEGLAAAHGGSDKLSPFQTVAIANVIVNRGCEQKMCLDSCINLHFAQ